MTLIGRRPAWLGPLVALLVVYAFFAAQVPDTFLSLENSLSMLQRTVVVAVSALGMSLVIATGGIDLSTGSLVAFTTVLVAKLLERGVPGPVAVLASCAALSLVGLVVGTLVGRFKMMPFIVTLGSMSLLRGAAKKLANDGKLDVDPGGLESLVAGDPLSPSIGAAVVLAIATAALLGSTRFGRHVLAVGSNERAVLLSGIDAGRVKLAVYVLASLLAGIAGSFEFATLTVGDPTDAVGLELKVIAAVVIGGAPLTGGRASIAGAMCGALLMTVIETGAVYKGLDSSVQEILTGVVIVVAVAVDRIRTVARRRPRGGPAGANAPG